jgi:HrpA-like RNA helicase
MKYVERIISQPAYHLRLFSLSFLFLNHPIIYAYSLCHFCISAHRPQLHADQKQWIFPLHSTLTSEEQLRVFAAPPKPTAGNGGGNGARKFVQKIVIATNIAETSITIDDCVFVIDSARMKETRFDPQKKMARYCFPSLFAVCV